MAVVEISARSNMIKALDVGSVHRISSGQVVVDLQTAVKELVENSLDADATSIDVRFKDHGVASFEVIDNGRGIGPEDYDAIALKHHTSKLSSFSDLASVATFGFRGEALSSLCALSESVIVTTATAAEAPMGTILEFDSAGRLTNRKGKVARQRGTTVSVSGLFKPLPVRHRELERNAKREFGKVLSLLSAYALVPCAQENKGVRLTVTHQATGGKKSVQIRTDGVPSTRASISALWGPKALENLVDLDIVFTVETERAVLRRRGILDGDTQANEVRVHGQISKFAVGCGRSGTDRQFLFVNGRPCSPSKVQKAFNEVYRTFNANQAPFIVADFILPTDSTDVNVSPDKRTILLHSEKNLIEALKVALEREFAPSRATYDITASGASQASAKDSTSRPSGVLDERAPLFLDEDEDTASEHGLAVRSSSISPNTTAVQDDIQPDAFGRPGLLVGNQAMGDSLVGVESPDEEATSARASEADGTSPPRACSPEEPADPEDREGSAGPSHRQASASLRGSAAEPRVALGEDSIARARAMVRDSEDLHSLVSVPMSQTQSALADSGSPSASQGVSILQAVDKTNESDLNSSVAYDLDAKRRFAEQNGGRSIAEGSRNVQMVLNTQGASWNLRRGAADELTAPKKRRRTGDLESSGEGLVARQGLRSTLRDYARPGSQIVDETMDEDDEADATSMHENQDALMDEDCELDVNVDKLWSSHEASGLPSGGESLVKQGYSALPGEVNSTVDSVIDLTGNEGDAMPNLADPDADPDITPDVSTISGSSSRASRPETVRAAEGEEAVLGCDLPRLTQTWRQLEHKVPALDVDSAGRTPGRASEVTQDVGISNVEDDARAAEALARVIDKSDFGCMEIIGQFNLGFIIGRRRKLRTPSSTEQTSGGTLDDLFIIDQHAADEKYNFETLQEATKIESQRLFQPQPLELAAADVLLVTENIDVLRRNGFEIEVDEDAVPGDGHRLHLVAQPTSKSTVFDMKDLEELLHLMQDRPTGQMVRCSKARAMFAMRACRKSVMIGMPLNRQQMISVVRHMGTMDQPWHCPHGRPTMRHLSDISGTGRDWRKERREEVDWTNFGSR
ncbi:DNA mismatch repair protein MutL [Daedalea quercina L-15889]|uniref:DNA mismatch repair protein PMS1 n=1 Tax=Daedalea quercina L-15889 TaxID=1314783 RepID=A0A165P6V8_9APHY|nr:DNA mismatch repair protein MutL [Daedalea quercina L-15889]